MDSLVENLLRELECPICLEYQVPPILQCRNGHYICNSCKPSLQNCPTCRGGFIDVRCRLMENLSNRITHPCKYKLSGCTGHFLMDFKEQHEKECLYSPHKCPFVISSACTWVGALFHIKEHIRSSHNFSDGVDSARVFSSKENEISHGATFIFDEFFFIYVKSLGNLIQMMIMFVGFEEEAKRYKYKLTIQTPDGVQSMSACLTCSSYIHFTENKPTFTDDVCAIFPSTFFRKMNEKSRVPFKLEIFKSPPKE